MVNLLLLLDLLFVRRGKGLIATQNDVVTVLIPADVLKRTTDGTPLELIPRDTQ
jgi:hypothetical protein